MNQDQKPWNAVFKTVCVLAAFVGIVQFLAVSYHPKSEGLKSMFVE